MYNDMNERIEKAQQGIFRLKKIDTMIENLRNEKEDLERKISGLQIEMEKENLDLQKLEGKSLSHIFFSVIGSYDKQLNKEQQEALAAKLKFDQAVKDSEHLNSEITRLLNERKDYKNCEREYNELYARKKELLIQNNSETAEKMMALSEQVEKAENNCKEIAEAITAGKRVMNSLDSTLASLHSAAGWGTWDLLGGGLISDLAKHSHIDDAKSEVAVTQRLLQSFKTELADVSIHSEIYMETGGFSKFADFFFDGLIADWNMQSRIHNSEDSVTNVRSQVESVMSKLYAMQNQEETMINQKKLEIEHLITDAQ